MSERNGWLFIAIGLVGMALTVWTVDPVPLPSCGPQAIPWIAC
jgi:hypothetical protein